MTAEATQIILTVGRARKVCVILAGSMTFQATLVYRPRGRALEAEDLRLVSASFNMLLAGTMARFASMPLWSFLRIQHGYVVRGSFIVLKEILNRHVFVAGFAGLGSHVKGRVRRSFIRFRLACGLRLVSVLLRPSRDDQDRNKKRCSEKWSGKRNVATNRP